VRRRTPESQVALFNLQDWLIGIYLYPDFSHRLSPYGTSRCSLVSDARFHLIIYFSRRVDLRADLIDLR
jgi:hypothetical protein